MAPTETSAFTYTVINNGLAPPHPENVIDASDNFSVDVVTIENVGCEVLMHFPCASPGDPTTVGIVDGALFDGRAFVTGTSTLLMTGGSVGGIEAFESATVEISGGTTLFEINANHQTSILITGGIINDDVEASESGLITMSAGWVEKAAVADESSTFEILGGSVGQALAASSASMIVSGGTVREFLVAFQASTLEMVGAGFQVDGVPVPFGPIAAETGVLTGLLASGDPLSNTFFHNGYDGALPEDVPGQGIPVTGSIVLVAVPEPALGLLVLAALVFAPCRRGSSA